MEKEKPRTLTKFRVALYLINVSLTLLRGILTYIDKEEFDDLNNLDFHLDLNGKTVQSGNSSEMIFTIDKIISYVSQFMTLKMGDVIYTGTPKGVGKVAINDRLEGWIGERKLLNFRVK